MSPERLIEIEELAARLIASCDGGDAEDQEMIEEMTQDECLILDSMAFECEDCGQWFDLGDADEDAAGAGRIVCGGCA